MSLNKKAAIDYNNWCGYSQKAIGIIQFFVNASTVGYFDNQTVEKVYQMQQSPLYGFAPGSADGMVGPSTLGVMIMELEHVSRKTEAAVLRSYCYRIAGVTYNKNMQPHVYTPAASNEASQGAPSKAPSVDWMNDIEGWQIKKHWGQHILDWSSIPPDGVEAKEFSPPSNMIGSYKAVFVWKSQTPNLTCVANPKERLQVLALLRDDMAYWQQRMPGFQQAVQVQAAAAAAVRDYRDFIICRKMCPKAAFNRLAAQGKDIIYLMLIGMFQLLSPTGLGGAPAGSGPIAEITHGLVVGLTTGKWPWTPYTDPSGDPFWSRYKNQCT